MLKVNRGELFKAMKIMAKVARPKASILIFSAVKIEASRGKVALVAADYDHQIEATIDGDGDLDICLPARDLLALVKGPKDTFGDVVEISANESVASIEVAGMTSRISGYPVADFPAPRPAPEGKLTRIAGIGSALAYTLPAMSRDVTRQWINSIHLDPEGYVVATDGHREHVSRVEGALKTAITLDAPVARLLGEVVKVAGDTIEIRGDETATEIRIGNYRITAKAHEAGFPEWRVVIPKVYPHTHARITLDAQELDALLARMVDPSNRDGGVTLHVNGSSLGVIRPAWEDKGQSEIKAAVAAEVVDCPDGTKPIGVSIALLRQALGPKPKGPVVISIAAPLDPIDVEQGGNHAVVMPMWI